MRLRHLIVLAVAYIVVGCHGSSLPNVSAPTAAMSEFSLVPAYAMPNMQPSAAGLRASSFGPIHPFYAADYLAQHPELVPHAGNMTYHGGPVLGYPHQYLLFYGRTNARVDNTDDPDNIYGFGYYFLKGMQGSTWLNTVTQYSHIANSRSQLRGGWYDPYHWPHNPIRSSDLAKEALLFVKTAKYDPQGNYIIMTPHGYIWPGYGKLCAFHVAFRTPSGTVAATLIPYVPDVSGCGRGTVNNPGIDDGVSINIGHEQAEAETDPRLNAWYGPGAAASNEIGDKCAWTDLHNTSFSSGRFPTQPLWSNAAVGCVNP